MPRRLSISALSVLHAISDGVTFGFDIIDVTGLPSGSVYPVLSRLERDGYVTSSWERETRAHAEGRPARRHYRLTAAGSKALAQAMLMYRSLVPSLGRLKAK